MSDYIQVEGHSNLLRDEGSTAIVNSDRNSYELHKKRRESFKSVVDKISRRKNL